MRFHTLKAHGLQITKYKEIHGNFEILEVLLLIYMRVFLQHENSAHIRGKAPLRKPVGEKKVC